MRKSNLQGRPQISSDLGVEAQTIAQTNVPNRPRATKATQAALSAHAAAYRHPRPHPEAQAWPKFSNKTLTSNNRLIRYIEVTD
jgi:hypothetical protein